jgi:hypothetical protein
VCIYNVPNGRILAPDTGCVQNKQRFATSSRLWPPASLQSAKSAAGAPWAVRGSHLSRLVSLPPLCTFCTTRLPHISTADALHLLHRAATPHINTVDEQRLAALRLALSKVLCLFVVFCGGSRRPVWRVHAACMIGRPAGRRAQKSGSDDC